MPEGAWLRRFYCLAMSADQADAIVGDLVELCGSRSRTWFWLQIMRTWARYALAKLWSHPGETAALAAAGLIVYSMFYLLLFQLIDLSPYREFFEPGDPLASVANFPAAIWLRLVLVVAGASAATGLLMGCLGSRRAANGVMPVFAVFVLYWIVWPLIGSLVPLRWIFIVGGLAGFPLFALLPLATGAVVGSRFRVMRTDID